MSDYTKTYEKEMLLAQEFMAHLTVYRFQQRIGFTGQLQIGKGDLTPTNKFIYQPFFASLSLDCDTIYQERYGVGRPIDVMAEAIAGDTNPRCWRTIAIGGGTILDIVKISALGIIPSTEELHDGKRSITRSRELILVSTACGAKSEMINITILALTRRNTKRGLAHDSMYADVAMLTPELLKHLPLCFFTTSSIGALIHAMEFSLSPRSSGALCLFSYHVISMILNECQEIATRGVDTRLECLEELLPVSTYAKIALGNVGCGTVHAMGYPLGAVCHILHDGTDCAMLAGVMEKYVELKSGGQIQRSNRHMAFIFGREEQDIYRELERLLNVPLSGKFLKEYGVIEEELQTFTDSVMTEWG